MIVRRPKSTVTLAANHLSNRRVQQREIAERAQVSVSTVSRVLNGIDGISDELKQRVLDAAAVLGYQPTAVPTDNVLQHLSLFAAQLSDQNTIDPFHADILAGVEAECRRQGVHLSYSVVEAGSDSTSFIMDKIKQANIDGLLFLALDDRTLIEQIIALKLHAVLINAEHYGLPIDTFLPDNRTGALIAVQHLIAHGHQHILHTTEVNRSTIKNRFEGYRQALEEAGISYDPHLLVHTKLEPNSAYAAMREWLASKKVPHFTAVFCANDGAAIGVIRALQEAGYSVPQDVSVVGFDDVPMAAFINPPLTTIRVERGEIGVQAVRRLLVQAGVAEPIPIKVEMFSRLIKRHSVADAKI